MPEPDNDSPQHGHVGCAECARREEVNAALLNAALLCLPHMQWVCGHYPPHPVPAAALSALRDAITNAKGGKS